MALGQNIVTVILPSLFWFIKLNSSLLNGWDSQCGLLSSGPPDPGNKIIFPVLSANFLPVFAVLILAELQVCPTWVWIVPQGRSGKCLITLDLSFLRKHCHVKQSVSKTIIVTDCKEKIWISCCLPQICPFTVMHWGVKKHSLGGIWPTL